MKIYKQCKHAAITLIVLGCIIFIFGSFGTEYIEYGGDAYTGIQNAAADTANNVSTACGILVASLGVVLLNYSNIKAFEYKESHQDRQVHSNCINAKQKQETSEQNCEISYCSNCGNKLTEDSLFCSNCGTKVVNKGN